VTVSLVTAAVVFFVAVIAVARVWSGTPWSASESARPTLPTWRRRRTAENPYESLVRRGLHIPQGLDRSLRPILRTVAASRLRRQGIDLRTQPDAAAARLGPSLAEAIGITGPPTDREHLMTTAELDDHLTRLEVL
jgi:hypothetical protein